MFVFPLETKANSSKFKDVYTDKTQCVIKQWIQTMLRCLEIIYETTGFVVLWTHASDFANLLLHLKCHNQIYLKSSYEQAKKINIFLTLQVITYLTEEGLLQTCFLPRNYFWVWLYSNVSRTGWPNRRELDLAWQGLVSVFDDTVTYIPLWEVLNLFIRKTKEANKG